MELTKQALRVDNNQSFPNNNNGQITPTALRTFNENMIDSTVNQAVYTADSASFDSRINNITGSATDTGSLLTTASFSGNTLTFTKGDNSTFGVVIPDVSGSTLPSGVVSGSSQINYPQISNIPAGIVSGSSQLTGSFVTLDTPQVITGLKNFNPSPDGSVGISMQNATRLTFGSVGTNRISSPDSNRLDLETINNAPTAGSPNTINVISGVNGSTLGDGSIINIETRGLQVGQSVNVRTTDFRVVGNTVISGSLNVSGSLTHALQQGFVLVGDSSGRTTAVSTGSFGGGTINTGSFATTGSNTFQGQQDIRNGSGLLFYNEGLLDYGFVGLRNVSGSLQIVKSASSNKVDLQNLSLLVSGTLTASLQQGYVWVGDSTGKTTTVPTSSFGGGGTGNGFPFSGSAVITGSLSVSETVKSQVYINPQTIDGFTIPTGNNAMLVGPVAISGSVVVEGNSNLLVLSQITASVLPSGVVSGSSQLTASYDLRYALSGSAPNINTGSFATTGSNTFIGNQTITGSLFLSSSVDRVILTAPNFNNFDPATKGGVYIPNSFTVDGDVRFGSAVRFGQLDVAKIVGSGGVIQGLAIVTDALIYNDSGVGAGKNLGVSGSVFVSQSLQVGGDLNVGGNKQFNVGAFQSNVSQSGSANVSQSMNFDVTDISQGVSIVSNSRITIANSGTYNIQFSAQIVAGGGADDIYIWLKKNGTNVPATAGHIQLGNNEEIIAAWNYVVDSVSNDYFEIVWQATNASTILLQEAASGNIPSVPSVIATVTQVR
jgi:hypothetical protein